MPQVHRWVRWDRSLRARAPQVQCWDSAVVRVDALVIDPPAAWHSAASAARSRPGVKAAMPAPQRRAQVLMLTSSVVKFGPWTAMICWAAWRALASLRRAVAEAAAAWSARARW
jgi:hypothetical protein